MRAGAAQAVITPAPGAELSGYGARVQPLIGVHDELYAKALYLESGGERLAWVHCDLIGFDNATAGRVRWAIAAELGLELRQVALSATHTHAGPATLFLRHGGRVDPAYLSELEGRLLGVARAAAGATEAVAPAWAEGEASINRDRRPPSPRAHVDRALSVLVLRRGGSPLAVIVNYGVHPVALTADNRLVSADLMGVAAAVLAGGLPGAPVVLMTNGGCANLNPVEVSAGFEAAERTGRTLGERALALTRAAAGGGEALSCQAASVPLALEAMTATEVERRYESYTRQSSDPRWLAAMADWRDDALRALAAGAERSVECAVQVVRIGAVAYALIAAEVFSRMAEELRAPGGPGTYVVSYANGLIGYLPPRDICLEGGYEPDVAARFFGRFAVAEGGHERVRETASRLLRAIGAGAERSA